MKQSSPKLSRPWRFTEQLISIQSNDVIIGNAELQNFSVAPIHRHIGVVLKCLKCSEEFDFTAKEQQYCYEKLKFWSDSAPRECQKCRKITRKIIGFNKRLAIVLSKKCLSKNDYNEITEIGYAMLQENLFIGGKLAMKMRMAAKRTGSSHAKSLLEKLLIS